MYAPKKKSSSGQHLYSLYMMNEILLFSEYLKIDGQLKQYLKSKVLIKDNILKLCGLSGVY